MKKLLARWMPLLGLLVVLSYWYSVRPFSAVPGYSEDLCMTDLSRQLMSDQIHQFGRPAFITDQVMTPEGASVPFMSWSPERDWLGSKIWDWNPDFPFSWAYTGLSWIVTYLLLGFILTRMGCTLNMGRGTAWALAAVITVFHVPRHFKMWHHWEHLNQHWLTLSFFLDAWIWMRLQRERVWDWRLELWRGFVGIGMIQSVGTFWGPLLLEWMVVHFSILAFAAYLRRKGERIALPSWRGSEWIAGTPVALGLFLLALDLRWYPPLVKEASKAGNVFQDVGWFARITYFFRPLWLEPIWKIFGESPLKPIDTTETVVAVGWFYWIPALLSMNWVRRKKGGQGFIVIAPFAVILVTAILYAAIADPPYYFQHLVQLIVPFMSYFRVASRWGLFLPQILAVIVILSWPELKARWQSLRLSPRGRFWNGAAAVFVILSLVECTWLTYPVNQSPKMSKDLVSLMEGIRKSPGEAVLDLPFCVAGGNGICTDEQCPQYPASTISQCMKVFHGKKVYGLYQGRMTPAHCEIYHKEPYVEWFQAWRQDRCFNEGEWKQFCSYLNEHSELSAVVLYPGIWGATSKPECLMEFDRHLGAPIAIANAMALASRDGKGGHPTQVVRYGTHCR